jgi:Holliday junction resolvase RusA-like endonuclease
MGEMMEPIVLSIKGQPPRKSNSRRIVTNRGTGAPMVVKSRQALAWQEAAAWQIPAEARRKVGGRDQPLRITFFVRYASRRPDLSTELILDVLQRNNVIADDRYVFEKVEYKQIDKENPGVDVIITATEEHTLTAEQRKAIIDEITHVQHRLVDLDGPFEDGSVLTHWSDGEWFRILPDGETTGYVYDDEGSRAPPASAAETERAPAQRRLRASEVLQIRRLYDTGEQTNQEIADRFGVSERTVRNIGGRSSWRNLPENDA